MATLKYFVGRPSFDWEALLQDVLENGVFNNIGAALNTLDLVFGDVTLRLVGSNLEAGTSRTLATGTITGMSLIKGGQTVSTISGLTSASASDFQYWLNNAGGLGATSEELKAVLARMFTGEFLNGTGSSSADSFIGTKAADTFSGGGGDDYIRGFDGVDTLNGGAGRDMIAYNYDTRSVGININLAQNRVVNNNAGAAKVDTISGFEDVHATRFADIIVGSSSANWIVGENGNDQISGGLGDDVLFDGYGNDLIFGQAGNDSLQANGGNDNDTYDGGTGTDVIGFSNLSGPVRIDLNLQKVTGTKTGTDKLISIENAQGSQSSDTIIGNSGENSLDGRRGNDNLLGRGGNDRLAGLAGNDKIDGGDGFDTVMYHYDHDGNGGRQGIVADLGTGIVIDTTAHRDTLTSIEAIEGSTFGDSIRGSSGNNDIFGFGGGDTLRGLAGTDWISGGLGNDILYGGAQADRFVFDWQLGTNNVDQIKDFAVNVDEIWLWKPIFTSIGTSFTSGEFRIGAAAADSNDRIIYNKSTGELTYDSNGSGAGGATVFAVLAKNLALDAGDIFVF